MAKAKYHSHLVYTLSIDNGQQYYVGSHNGNRDYTEYAILSQSGNILQRETVKTHNWDEYYSRVKLVDVEQFTTEEDALTREQELIDKLFLEFPKERILNVRSKGNFESGHYSYDHDDSWKLKFSSSIKHPKACSTKRMGRKAS